MKLFVTFLAIVIASVYSDEPEGPVTEPYPAESTKSKLHNVEDDDESKAYGLSSLSSLLHHSKKKTPVCQCNCPTPQCGLNERYEPCKSVCKEKCERERVECDEIAGCIPGCSCITGYARIGSYCVPASQCPPRPPCRDYEVYVSCKSVCNEKCPGERAMCPPEPSPCSPGCTCIAGRFRVGSNCVLGAQCPPIGPPSPSCGTNEIFTQCRKLCNEKCPSERASCAETPQCAPSGCACVAGSVRVGTSCVSPTQCPSSSSTATQ